ncbi:hypothetical protein FUAX_55980 (plasmid) [Fulvitalea axinellae]|uniref:Uncharacterized protein n=1 Tax=Fulvitalea axinellae TaxID=1182444 RepID=A0AAU9DJ64_9BACT|nr:hypothetical protein FUAX_55980 [Fulvitalea axinellae]
MENLKICDIRAVLEDKGYPIRDKRLPFNSNFFSGDMTNRRLWKFLKREIDPRDVTLYDLDFFRVKFGVEPEQVVAGIKSYIGV